MSLLVIGSIAIDTVESPYGKVVEELGGSAVYFSFAASCLTPVRLVGVIGEDFPSEYLDRIAARRVDLSGIHRLPGRTFRWHGSYEGRMEQAETLQVQMNVFGGFEPTIPPAYADSQFVFLANGSPVTHMRTLEQLDGPKFIMADTMNHYIANERDALLALMGRIHAMVINDAEALQLTGQANPLAAARWIAERGPRWCIVKKGEHGALLHAPEGVFAMPAMPCEEVVDPTGAGDSFAGGLMGYLARENRLDADSFKRGLAYGTVAASFAIERFGPWALEGLGETEVEERHAQLLRATQL
jgi:sugar/nucleoside kinase (ribokinase family)